MAYFSGLRNLISRLRYHADRPGDESHQNFARMLTSSVQTAWKRRKLKSSLASSEKTSEVVKKVLEGFIATDENLLKVSVISLIASVIVISLCCCHTTKKYYPLVTDVLNSKALPLQITSPFFSVVLGRLMNICRQYLSNKESL